jgi:hypothetical protein
MLNGDLRVGMSEAVSGPSNFGSNSEFCIQEIISNCVLVNDIIEVADCLVILDPSSVGHLELPLLE